MGNPRSQIGGPGRVAFTSGSSRFAFLDLYSPPKVDIMALGIIIRPPNTPYSYLRGTISFVVYGA